MKSMSTVVISSFFLTLLMLFYVLLMDRCVMSVNMVGCVIILVCVNINIVDNVCKNFIDI